MIAYALADRDRLVVQYRYLCARGARKFLRAGLERADLEQVAAIGLLKACDRYDASLQTPFEAFAWLFVVGELMHHVRDHERLVRPPRRLRSLERRWLRACEELTGELGREPARAEIARRLNVAPQEIDALRAYRDRAMPQALEDVHWGKNPAAMYTIDESDDAIVLQEAMRGLSEPERTIVRAIYTSGFTQAEVAQRLGYSPRHISRLHRSALCKMQPMLRGCLGASR